MDKKNNFEEQERIEEVNKENSILNIYANVKKTNNFRNFIEENNEEILKEMSKYNKKISVIKGDLNILQNSIGQIQTVASKNMQELETKLSNDVNNIVEKQEKETNETVQKLIKKIEENKKNNEEQKKLLHKKIQELETKNKALTNDKIKELNINNIRENIKNIEKNIENIKNQIPESEQKTLDKIKELELNINNKLEYEKKENEEFSLKLIHALNIDEIKNSISNLEISSNAKIQGSENILREEIKKENENVNNIIENNIHAIKEQIVESETILKTQIDSSKKENENLISQAIGQLNIEEIKNNIINLESLITQKTEELNAILDEKIKDLNYFETIHSLESTIQDLKEKLLNVEYYTKTISKKVEELDSINQKKLDKVRKEQEKFILEKLKESNNIEELNNLRNDITELSAKAKEIESLINASKESSIIEMQDYVEKRILRMKFNSTIQLIVKEINGLKKKISMLQGTEANGEEFNTKIENIIQQKLKNQENIIMNNINSIVEKKLKEALKDIYKNQKIVSTSNQVNANFLVNKKNKKRAKNVPSSLDDMVATLTNLPNVNSRNIEKKSISTITKATKKSQILNSDNY